ncbi:MAG: hypothetical protein AB1306_09930 [Nitrospirota bacterium]
MKSLIAPIIAGIVAGLVAGWILNIYQNRSDRNKVIANLTVEITKNLPLLKQYLNDIADYRYNVNKPEEIYNLQYRIFYTNAYQSVKQNLSLVDNKSMENILLLYHNYDQLQKVVPYSLIPQQDKPIGEYGWHRVGGPPVWKVSSLRAEEILNEKKKILEDSISLSEAILDKLHD